jgi:hypothetical protein
MEDFPEGAVSRLDICSEGEDPTMRTPATMFAILTVAAVGSGCGPVLHAEMLAESIRSFSSRAKLAPAEKLWIAGPDDSGCDRACQCCGAGGKGGALGGLFGKPGGSSANDKLAYEVFSNYLTQRKKVRVIETHRHNYATELNPETHRKVEVAAEGQKLSTTTCEDLCMLDEAKKRKAEKVLAYRIRQMSNNELTIHFRLSDVPTGVVIEAVTLKVKDLRANDVSLGETFAGGGGGGGVGRRGGGGNTED